VLDHFVWSVIVAPPLIVAIAWLLADRLPPAPAARMFAWSAAGAALASAINLALFTVKAVAEVPLVDAWLGWSRPVVLADTAQAPWVSWLSVALTIWCTVAVSRRARQQRRVRRQAAAIARLPHRDLVIVVADPAPDAYSIPGAPGRIVVTTGMRDQLSEPQYAALLAHEQAHLGQRHHRLIRIAELAAAAHPALRGVTARVDYLVERAADEHAAVQVGSRHTVAHAIGQAALAGGGRRATADSLHIAAAPGIVPRRVGELLRPSALRCPPMLQSLPAVLAVASIIWTGEAAYDLWELLQAARVAAG
jgi:Zn-dependent protease with chaperone function